MTPHSSSTLAAGSGTLHLRGRPRDPLTSWLRDTAQLRSCGMPCNDARAAGCCCSSGGAAARARLSTTLDVTRIGCELQRPCMCPSTSPVGRQLLIPSRDSVQLPSELLAQQMPLHSRTSTLNAHWSAKGPVLRDRAAWRATGSIMWHTDRLRSGTSTPVSLHSPSSLQQRCSIAHMTRPTIRESRATTRSSASCRCH